MEKVSSFQLLKDKARGVSALDKITKLPRPVSAFDIAKGMSSFEACEKINVPIKSLQHIVATPKFLKVLDNSPTGGKSRFSIDRIFESLDPFKSLDSMSKLTRSPRVSEFYGNALSEAGELEEQSFYENDRAVPLAPVQSPSSLREEQMERRHQEDLIAAKTVKEDDEKRHREEMRCAEIRHNQQIKLNWLAILVPLFIAVVSWFYFYS